MPNIRHDRPRTKPRHIGLVPELRRHQLKHGELNRPFKGDAYVGGHWIETRTFPEPLRLTSQDFHITKGWGKASRSGKRNNRTTKGRRQ